MITQRAGKITSDDYIDDNYEVEEMTIKRHDFETRWWAKILELLVEESRNTPTTPDGCRYCSGSLA